MALLGKGTIWYRVSSLSGQQDTSLKKGTIPLKTGRLVTLQQGFSPWCSSENV
jgi:hypothetical protein